LSACSFNGSWFPVELIHAFFGLVAAAFLVPVLVAAWIGGWRAPAGRGVVGALQGAGWVLAAYVLMATLFAVIGWLDMGRTQREYAEAEALSAQVQATVPGDVAATLQAARAEGGSTRHLYGLAGALAGRLSERDDWTVQDWQAVDGFAAALRRSLAAGGMSSHHADTLDGLRLQAQFGPDRELEAKVACLGVQRCVDAVAQAAYQHDSRLVASVAETRIDAPAAPLPAAVRAARERNLVRLRVREAGNPYGRESDLSLAWDRLAPGQLQAALSACVAGFPASRPANVYGRICIDDFAALLRAHGTQRLCPGGRIEASDRELLRRWRARAEADGENGYLAAQSLAGLQGAWRAECPDLASGPSGDR
jgi:hypothetical protein